MIGHFQHEMYGGPEDKGNKDRSARNKHQGFRSLPRISDKNPGYEQQDRPEEKDMPLCTESEVIKSL